MKRYVLRVLVLFACCPLFASAQGFKCKMPDGSLSFQEQPCPAGATSSSMPSAPPSSGIMDSPSQSGQSKPSRYVPSQKVLGDPAQNKAHDAERRRMEEDVRAQNEKAAAHNKMVRCNYARQQLGVVKEYKPVYSRDNKGDRQYVENENRASVIAAAEQRVAEACN